MGMSLDLQVFSHKQKHWNDTEYNKVIAIHSQWGINVI